MNTLERIIKSEYLYPLWRIGWLERAFFLACRRFGKQEAQKLFTDLWKGHDVSYYQGYINFQIMKDTGAKFVIPRLGYGVTKDTQFDNYMRDVQGLLPHNPYHFYHPELSPVAQADKVLAILAPYQQRIGRVWLDLEYDWSGAYTDSRHWKTYRDGINTVYRTGWYTRATWWDSRVGTLAAEFARDPIWAAQYNTALTLIPKGWTKAMIWQSGSPAYDAGQTSPRIDYDLWNTDFGFAAEWGSPSSILDGYQKIRRCNSDVYLWRGAPKRVHVTNTGGKLETVSSAAKRLSADFAVNGDGWVSGINVPLSYAASDGNFYQRVQFDGRPYFAASQANQYSFGHLLPSSPYNLVSGTRYLVKDGANNFAASTDPNHISVLHPRTATGITNDGKVVLCVVDGRTTQSAGMTLRDLATLMLEAGAAWALELDGGGSSTFVKSGAVQNVPSDGTERAVVNHLLVYTEGQTMTKYTAIAISDGTRLRSTPSVNLPYTGIYPLGTKFNGDTLFIATADSSNQLAGDKWLQVTDINGVAKSGWVAIIHMSKPICQLIDNTPPPPAGEIQFNATLKADGTITGTWTEI